MNQKLMFPDDARESDTVKVPELPRNYRWKQRPPKDPSFVLKYQKNGGEQLHWNLHTRNPELAAERAASVIFSRAQGIEPGRFSWGEGEKPDVSGFVYVATMTCEKCEHVYVKVGKTRSSESRLRGIQTPVAVDSFLMVETHDCGWVEEMAHKILGRYRSHGEWFNCSPEEAADAVRKALEFAESGRNR